jgi:3D (Asp-Asp-Asp) domain-containing protein
MVQEELYQRLSKVESKVEQHEKMLDEQVKKNEDVIEIKTLMKMQIEINQRTNEQMEKFSQVLSSINENITRLNINQSQLSERVTDIEKSISNNKIDILQWTKNILYSLLLAGIFYWFGIKK